VRSSKKSNLLTRKKLEEFSQKRKVLAEPQYARRRYRELSALSKNEVFCVGWLRWWGVFIKQNFEKIIQRNFLKEKDPQRLQTSQETQSLVFYLKMSYLLCVHHGGEEIKERQSSQGKKNQIHIFEKFCKRSNQESSLKKLSKNFFANFQIFRIEDSERWVLWIKGFSKSFFRS